MGSCTRRHFLLSICFLQMITIIERQVFDFLGYMWAPIFVNFFHMLFIIFGFYGAYHFKVKYIITYLIWSFCWIGWNAFLICFYLNVGELDKDSDLLNLGTGSASWFEVNGPGCKPFYPTNITSDDPYRPIRPERVDDCYLDYTIIEVIHSGVQSGLSILGIIGAICISCLFVDEDDRFDFMNGDAKSPQHTVVHPMYVSYTSIPTSASATMLSNKHHHHHQNHHNNQNQANHQQQHQHSYNNNTFLIHSNSNTPNASKNNTINSNSSRKLYSTKNKISSSTTTIIPTTAMQELQEEQVQQQQQHKQKQQHQQQYYDDSTAKADHQLYTNNNSQRQQMLPAIKQNALATAATPSSTATTSNNLAYQQQQQQQQNVVAFNHNNNNNNSLCTNTNSSLSYASLQKFSAPNSNEFFSSNSNLNMAASLRGSGGVGIVGIGAGAGVGAGLSNSNYSITNNNNNNNNNTNLNSGGGGGGGVGNGSGRFACIHAKPKPPKSSSYSNFINGSTCVGIGPDDLLQHHHRPDIKYSQVSNDQLHNFEETFEDDLDDDIISMQNFKADAATYVPFQKPTPAPHHHFTSGNNNPSYASLNSNYSGTSVNTPTTNNNIRVSPNNNNVNIAMGSHPLTRDNSHFFLRNDNDLLLERSSPISHTPITPQSQLMVQRQPSFLNPASRILCQQNGLPFQPSPLAAAYKPHSNSQRPQRPSNIPLPTVPHHQPPHYYPHSPISPSDVTPPPPPAPRPHIFQPRSGHAPYPDLSPEVTEKYAMPTQYVPRSPVASRIARRQRQHQQHERSHLANTAANFCDQIRDAPPGYIDTGFNIVRAKSHDRLTSISRTNCDNDGAEVSAKGKSSHANSKDAAPNVNRRSGRGKVRPRSYCNSSTGGEGVIRGTVLSGHDNGVAGGGVISSGFGVPTASNYVS